MQRGFIHRILPNSLHRAPDFRARVGFECVRSENALRIRIGLAPHRAAAPGSGDTRTTKRPGAAIQTRDQHGKISTVARHVAFRSPSKLPII